MTVSKIFLYFCLSFILGIFVNSFFNISLILTLIVLILGILLISVFWRRKDIVVIGFCLIFLVLGISRHQMVEPSVVDYQEQKVILTGVVIKEPDIREDNIKLTISSKQIDGKVLVTVERYPEYQYGDELKITGRLKPPAEFPDFNYKDYLAKDGIYSVMYKPKIELINRKNYRGQASVIYGKILGFKDKLRKNIEQNFSPPQSSILGAIILGDKRQISQQWQEKLNIAGVRHITCVSGMHIVILSGILMWLGIRLGLYRGQAFYFALILIFLFIIMIGAPASAIRAGIMGGLFLLGQKLGRLSTSSRAIVFAGAIMLFHNPLLLKSDVGFQLSFLAVLGIIYLMPVFQKLLARLNFSSENFGGLRDIISMTIAAQIFTLPLLIFNFGYISLVSLIANVLIVPIVSFIMISGFIFVISGIIYQPLAWILALPCWMLLTYLIKIVDFLSQIPFATLSLEVSWIWLIIFYLILAYTTRQLTKKDKYDIMGQWQEY
ncbi:ComEC family competence protein [Candidatus Parcubacteria bacterium]|nr:ComEC family competence protein [Candidatus Parcubacteria bacterium]